MNLIRHEGSTYEILEQLDNHHFIVKHLFDRSEDTKLIVVNLEETNEHYTR